MALSIFTWTSILTAPTSDFVFADYHNYVSSSLKSFFFTSPSSSLSPISSIVSVSLEGFDQYKWRSVLLLSPQESDIPAQHSAFLLTKNFSALFHGQSQTTICSGWFVMVNCEISVIPYDQSQLLAILDSVQRLPLSWSLPWGTLHVPSLSQVPLLCSHGPLFIYTPSPCLAHCIRIFKYMFFSH